MGEIPGYGGEWNIQRKCSRPQQGRRTG